MSLAPSFESNQISKHFRGNPPPVYRIPLDLPFHYESWEGDSQTHFPLRVPNESGRTSQQFQPAALLTVVFSTWGPCSEAYQRVEGRLMDSGAKNQQRKWGPYEMKTIGKQKGKSSLYLSTYLLCL